MKNQPGFTRQLYRIFFRQSLRTLPKLLLTLLLAGGVCAGLFFFLARTYDETDQKMAVGVVMEAEDPIISAGLSYITGQIPCTFVRFPSEDAALSALDQREVIAVLHVGGAADALAVSNEDVQFTLAEDENPLTKLFQHLVAAGLSDFMVLRNAVAALRNSYTDVWEPSKALRQELMFCLIQRSSCFSRTTFSDTGGLPLLPFYLGSGLTLLFLLCASIMTGLVAKPNPAFLLHAGRTGISRPHLFLAQYYGTVCFTLGAAALLLLACQLFYRRKFSLPAFAAGLFAVLVLLLFVIFIQELVKNRTIGTLASILASVFLLFFSGNIIPLSLLPPKIEAASDCFLTKWTSALFGQIFYGGSVLFPALYLGGFFAALALLLSLLLFRRGGRTAS